MIKILYIIPISINIILVLQINGIDNFFINLEKQTNFKEQIKYDKEIKYDIMIDRIFDKIGINVTDEDIEQYKNNIKQKYKMEE